MQKFRIISIDGNIGSGKSTLLENLKQRLESKSVLFQDQPIIFLKEPVEEWETIKDEDGITMPRLMSLYIYNTISKPNPVNVPPLSTSIFFSIYICLNIPVFYI